MRYTCNPKELIESFKTIDIDYAQRKGINIYETPPWYTLFKHLGATDVVSRLQQTTFLKKIQCIVANIIDEKQVSDPIEIWQANLTGSKIMITAALFIESQISPTVLHQIIFKKNLKITEENYLDQEDRECYFTTTAFWLNVPDSFNKANAILTSQDMAPFNKSEWTLFSQFILTENTKRAVAATLHTNYPISTAIEPIFEQSFAYTGATLGWVLAGVVSNSSLAISPRMQLTLIASSLLAMGSTSSTGIALIAPALAAQFLSIFCTVSFSRIGETGMSYAGKGLAHIVGLPLDLIYKLLKVTWSLISDYATSPTKFAPIDGIRLADGVFMVQGNPIQFKMLPQKELIKASMQSLRITQNGEIFLGNALVEDPEKKMSAVIKELSVALEKRIQNYPDKSEVLDLEEAVLDEYVSSVSKSM
jgi:hypothetical protein